MDTLNIYKQILDGRMTINLSKVNVKLENEVFHEEVIVTPVPTINMLEGYLHDSVSAEDLSEWAAFLLSSDVYVCPDWQDDEKSDKYELMWYALQQLSSPEIDGKITPEVVRKHLQVLNSIN
jgi:hypothetical protein